MKQETVGALSRLVGRIYSLLFVLFVAADVSLAQNWTHTGTVTNNGAVTINGNIVNSGTGTLTVNGTGTLTFIGTTAGSHSIQCSNLTNKYPVVLNNALYMTGSRVTTLNTPTTVNSGLGIGNGTAYTATGNGFSIGTQTLTVGGASSYMATSTAALTFSGGTVNYTAASGSQTVLVGNTTTTYGVLGLTGNANMTIPNVPAGSVSIATLTHSGTGTLTVNDSTTITTSASIGTLATVASGKLLRISGTASSSIATVSANAGTIQNYVNQPLGITTVTTNAGTIDNNNSGTLTIATLSGNAGTVSQSGASGTISFTNAERVPE